MQKKRTDNFSKFAEKKKGAAIKESYRQEKRKVKADARAAGEEMRMLKKAKARGEAIEPKKVEDKRAVGKNPERKKTAYQQKDFKKGPRNAAPGKTKLINGPEQASDTAIQDRDSLIPLNKFIAHAGVCGRREAAELVKGGKVTVNGDKIFEPGFKVSQADKITVKGKAIFLQKNNVYILLNKPKDFITTANDPQGRKTVLDLIKGATLERVYPVGRLDRNTTGVLLLTNDGELAQKLTHPSFEVKKIYEVTLDKAVTKKDLELIVSGVTLEDGFVQADSVGYADSKSKNVVGIEIHSGRNRIVRRIFEHLGYDVKGLDRVLFANLTKKNVERSKWRILNEKEIRLLKFMNKSFIRKNKEAV
ncbi:MAG: rRNA pseudouridine synthase [Sphingobacteriia bacterium]|nr:MAG: rRNA pseudouridine synthase [Sphingobacteriia bacterium]